MSQRTFDTIVAPATAPGRSALAILRVDGPDASRILESLGGGRPEVRRATRVTIADSEGPIDDCVVVRYEAPGSFTGNDLVEITLHGNPVLLQRAAAAALRCGARVAEAGEFTERAVLNGRIDLVQAEAIADLIAARTSLQARVSLRNLEGVLSRMAGSVRTELLHVISRLEASLDFSEEGYDFIQRGDAAQRLAGVLTILEQLSSSFVRGRTAVTGLRAVILGLPNAGKSTLLNRLVGSDVAIVTAVPGTTRDVLTKTIEIGGLPVELSDTAGLREGEELVERIGIDRARSAGASADLILYLVDSSEGLSPLDENELAQLPQDRLKVIYTKTDLRDAPADQLSVSVATGQGMDRLMEELDSIVRANYLPGELTLVNERQLTLVTRASESIRDALDSIELRAGETIVLVDLYGATRSLSELTGAITNDDVLTEIFSKFCIGK